MGVASALPPSGARGGSPALEEGAHPEVAFSPMNDVGVFTDLNDEVAVRCPEWLAPGPSLAVRLGSSPAVWRSVGGVIVCAEDSAAQGVQLESQARDQDGDGIPDNVDTLRGAKKAVANGAAYRSSYQKLEYPGGDVPREQGVCTDVIVRALRNAGIDLQERVHEDIRRRPQRYPMVAEPDRNIDHRRVKTLLPYFLAHYPEHGREPADGSDPFIPGDLVFFNTLGDDRPDHVGIVSDHLGRSGHPLIVNNWTNGYRTNEMDLLGQIPVTHRFRLSQPLKAVEGPDQGLSGLLRRRGLSLPPDSKQLLLVVTPLWESSAGTLRRLERHQAAWAQVGAEIPVRIGRSGLAKGLGLHSAEANAGAPTKQEGDGRAPAGVFSLGTAFGPEPVGPHASALRASDSPLSRHSSGHWPWRQTRDVDFYVDDPKSPAYNTWQHVAPGSSKPWGSAERLLDYSLALVVNHNPKGVPGAGSAIFLHPWQAADVATAGCTVMDSKHLVELLSWLNPNARPVLVQTSGALL